MKSKTNKLSPDLILANSLLAASIPAFAVTGDTEQLIHIESDQQSLDIQDNVATFAGNVAVTQGTIKISANKAAVTRPDGENGKEMIDGYGNSVTFHQIQGNGKPAKGHASQIHYGLAKDFVALAGKAYLERFSGSVAGDKITYLVKEQRMQAFNDKGERITTVLVPLQSQDKNRAPAEKEGN